MEACLEAGFPDEPDKNAPGPEGIGPVPRNVLGGIRMNTGITYIAPVRDRRNLTIVGNAVVTRVLFDGTRAIGVEAVRDGRRVRFSAGEVILSAGGIKTPHLLLLSGIGPAAHLRSHGIDIVHDSPGVGQGLKDHPTIIVNFRARDDAMPVPEDLQPFETCLNYTSPGSAVKSDVQLMCGVVSYSRLIKAQPRAAGRAARVPSYLKRPVATLSALRRLPFGLVLSQARRQDDLTVLVSLEAEESAGEISLKSGDPAAAPVITFNYFSDPADLPRVLDNLRLAVDLLRSGSFRSLRPEIVSPGPEHLRGDEELRDWIVSNIGSAFHSTNSARMGPASDPAAVVDQHCRVHGVEGLRVADLSVAPRIRRGPAATAVVIGERVAGLIDGKDEAPT
jgi:choline dehydrogenase-like flavoprotein